MEKIDENRIEIISDELIPISPIAEEDQKKGNDIKKDKRISTKGKTKEEKIKIYSKEIKVLEKSIKYFNKKIEEVKSQIEKEKREMSQKEKNIRLDSFLEFCSDEEKIKIKKALDLK